MVINIVASAKPKQHKYIYYNKGAYVIEKKGNGEKHYFGRYQSLSEAMKVRDFLISQNWNVKPTPEEVYLESQKKYYTRIYKSHNKTQYYINNRAGLYLGVVPTIEEALYLRDLYSDEYEIEKVPHVDDMDLKTNNPYIENGLAYPLPDRLILEKPRTTGHGFGVIRKRDNHYRLERGGKYYATCITYEQAYFYYQEFNKRGWDKKNIPGIKADYPEWYTWLNQFYIYISRHNARNRYNWKLTLTPYNNGKLEHLGYVNLEDALFERDFLMAHDWNYELLVECIDDSLNPYYDMELPPYPERRIRNIFLDNNHDEELARMRDYIMENGDVTREEVADYMNITSMTIGNWMNKYHTSFRDFKKLCLMGEDPLNYFSMPKHIYTPDLSPCRPKHFRNYVTKNKQNKTNPYKIVKDGVCYGVYPTREIASKISNELQRIGWSDENRRKLQAEYNLKPFGEKRYNIYPTRAGHYCVRRKLNGKMVQYGTFDTWMEAALIRDQLKQNNWDKELMPVIREAIQDDLQLIQSFKSNMFNGKREEDIL